MSNKILLTQDKTIKTLDVEEIIEDKAFTQFGVLQIRRHSYPGRRVVVLVLKE